LTSIIASAVAVLASFDALQASAGKAPAKAPVPPLEPEPAALFDTLGASLSVGYDSRLYYRGLWFADNTVTTALNLAIPLIGGSSEDAGSLTLNLGAAYIATFETPVTGVTNNAFDYSEFDIIAGLSYDTGFAILGVQYQYYGYPDTYSGSVNGVGVANGDPELGVTGANEVGITALIPIGALNLSFGYYYDFTIGGSYIQAAVDYTIPVTDWLSIVPALQAGYGFDYYTGSDGPAFAGVATDSEGFTHLLMSISTPIKLTQIATLTPYVAWNYGFDTRNYMNATHDNEIFGGVKLTVAF
jgi:hypothetical protein